MRKFKLASLLLTTILLTNISFGQTCDSTCCEQPQNQIQFHLVNDYSVSYLKMLTPSSGLRFKIDLGLMGNSGDEDIVNKKFYSANVQPQWNLQNRAEESSNSYQYVNLVANYIIHIKFADEVNCYIGAGPLLSFSHSSSESNTTSVGTIPNQSQSSFYVSKSEHFDRNVGVGLQAVFGIEVMLTQKLSLLAEFNLNGTYSWSKYSSVYEYENLDIHNEENTSDGTSWNYGLNQLKLGIACRF